MNEPIQSAVYLLGMLTVVRLLIVDSLEIINQSISKLNSIVTNIKKLMNNIKK